MAKRAREVDRTRQAREVRISRKLLSLVVSPGPNLIDIVVVDGSGRLYHKSWNGSSWFPSQTGFGSLAGDLVAVD